MRDLTQAIKESILDVDFGDDVISLQVLQDQLNNEDYWRSSDLLLSRGGVPYTIEGSTLHIKGSVVIHYNQKMFMNPMEAGIDTIEATGHVSLEITYKDGSVPEIDGNEFVKHIKARAIRIKANTIKNIDVEAETMTIFAATPNEELVLDNVDFNNKFNIVFHNTFRSNNIRMNGYPIIFTDRFGDEGGWRNKTGKLDNIIQLKPGTTLKCGKSPRRKGAAGLIAVVLNPKKYPVTRQEMEEVVECPLDILKALNLSSVVKDTFVLMNGRFKCIFCKDPKPRYASGATTNSYTVKLTGPNEGWYVVFYGNNFVKDNSIRRF